MHEIINKHLDDKGNIKEETINKLSSNVEIFDGNLNEALHIPPNTQHPAFLWILDDEPLFYEFYKEDNKGNIKFNWKFFVIDDREDIGLLAMRKLEGAERESHIQKMLEKIEHYNEMSAEERFFATLNPFSSNDGIDSGTAQTTSDILKDYEKLLKGEKED